MIWGLLIGLYFGFGLGMGIWIHADGMPTKDRKERVVLSTIIFFLWAPALLGAVIANAYEVRKENRKQWRKWHSRTLTKDDDNLWMPSLRLSTNSGLDSATEDFGWFTVEVWGGKPATYWQRGHEPGSKQWT